MESKLDTLSPKRNHNHQSEGHKKRKRQPESRPFPCTFSGCLRRFTRKDNMLQHLKNYHINESQFNGSCQATIKFAFSPLIENSVKLTSTISSQVVTKTNSAPPFLTSSTSLLTSTSSLLPSFSCTAAALTHVKTDFSKENSLSDLNSSPSVTCDTKSFQTRANPNFENLEFKSSQNLEPFPSFSSSPFSFSSVLNFFLSVMFLVLR